MPTDDPGDHGRANIVHVRQPAGRRAACAPPTVDTPAGIPARVLSHTLDDTSRGPGGPGPDDPGPRATRAQQAVADSAHRFIPVAGTTGPGDSTTGMNKLALGGSVGAGEPHREMIAMSYHIEAGELAEQITASVQACLPPDRLADWLPTAYQEVLAHLDHAHMTPTGPPYARFTFHDDVVHVEAGFPVPAAVPALGRVAPSSLPGGPAATTTHHGRYEDLPAAYEAISRWFKDRGYEPAGPHWEVYCVDPRIEPDPTYWRTDLVAPYHVS